MPIVTAVLTTDTHPSATAYNSAGSFTGKGGIRIIANTDVNITQMCKHVNTTATIAYIADTSIVTLNTSAYSGNCADMRYNLSKGVSYYALDDKGGASYNIWGKSGITYTYPAYSGTNINFTGGYAGGAEATSAYDIVNITTEVLTGYPINWSIRGVVTYATVVMANVTVLLINDTSRTIIANTTTNESGVYVFSSVNYTVIMNQSIFLLQWYFRNSTLQLSKSNYTQVTIADAIP